MLGYNCSLSPACRGNYFCCWCWWKKAKKVKSFRSDYDDADLPFVGLKPGSIRSCRTIDTGPLHGKGKERKRTCIAPIVSISTTKRSDVDHTVTCKYTTSAFPSYKHSLEGDTAANGVSHLTADVLVLLIPVPLRVRGWVGLVGWPIADALPTKWSHVNHRSGAWCACLPPSLLRCQNILPVTSQWRWQEFATGGA